MNIVTEPYIEQQDEQDALYTKLQRQTLTDVQHLSGHVWTDFNPHDPGVTLAEAANYALTELDYKLSFPLLDYLVEENKTFDLKRFGLFPASDVLAQSIVTVEDYRQLLLRNIPEIANIQIENDSLNSGGGYSISYVKMPFYSENDDVTKKIVNLYNENRNLCEWLDKVEVAESEKLYFESEFDIDSGEDPSIVLARVYWCILHYLSDDFYDTSSKTRTAYELYKFLYNVEGVKSFRTCFLKLSNIPQSRFPENATVFIPTTREELERINMYCGNTNVRVDVDLFQKALRGFCLGNRMTTSETGDSCNKNVTGVMRDIFSHYPIAYDIPDCYRLNPGNRCSSFDAYIALYDWVISNGLKEAKMLPQILSIEEDESFVYSERTIRLKNDYLDFLDNLYGVDSNPSWMREENRYGETPVGTLYRRMRFLRSVVGMQKERSRGRDILLSDDEGQCPVVKEWFCLLLGIEPDDMHFVSNVLPSYNLKLVEYKEDFSNLFMRVDSFLINEKMMKAENIHNVSYVELSKDIKTKNNEYDEMRCMLPFFNENVISGDLFRNGTDLKNYKIVRMIDGEFLLLYRHKEIGGWTNLGHSTDISILERLANILRRYLRELNHMCETIYIVEPVLADASRPFELAIVLPAWTYRFHKPRFREECCKLLRSLLPAHLSGNLYWVNEHNMRKFEFYYHQLLTSLANDKLVSYRKPTLVEIYEIIEGADEIMNLDDQY